MTANQGGSAIGSKQVVNALFDAKMMPAGDVSDIPTMQGYLFQGRNERIWSAQYVKDIEVSLTLEISNEKTEEKAKV
jgi:hypothetical protein